MTNLASLDNLHDIISPPALPLYPPAPGWFVVGFLLVCAIFWFAGKWYVKRKKNAYRRDALLELNHLEQALKNGGSLPETLLKLPELLKRTALSAYGREEVASLTSMSWLTFLESRCPETRFTNRYGELMIAVSYKRPETIAPVSKRDIKAVLALTRKWIIKHEKTNCQ